MKRNLSLLLGLLAFAAIPMLAQSDAPKNPSAQAKIHGHVTSPTGSPYNIGTVVLTMEDGRPTRYSFPVRSTGDYAGEADPGTYMVLFRLPDTPPGKMVDEQRSIRIIAGQDTAVDFDMTRKEFMDALSPETKKAIEEAKKKNAETGTLIKTLNADIQTVLQDFKDAGAARATAVAQLGATAARADIEAKENEIKIAKFTEAEGLMMKDTALKPDAAALWVQLGQAQLGLKKYDEAEATYKKTLEVEAASAKPKLPTQALADAGLGEIYARTGKVAEATAAYEAAAKLDPTMAAAYLTNEAVIYSQVGNADAQAAAADAAIKADPTKPRPYYLKAQGLIPKATVDPQSGKMILPEGCAEAYQKFLELAPPGDQLVAEVKAILEQANQKIDSSYKAPKPPKK